MSESNNIQEANCLNRHKSPCEGPVLYRERYSFSIDDGKTFPRCDKHYNEYVDHIDNREAKKAWCSCGKTPVQDICPWCFS